MGGPKGKKDRNSLNSSHQKDSMQTSSKNHDRLEQLQADHELFLQAFEKPTQIYRYLRTRNMISPIFLHRSLTFMGKRRSRQQSDKLRADFKVDSLLKRKESEIRDSDSLSMNDRFMNLTFLGYYDKKMEKNIDKVSVELVLVKLTHKKRKESVSPFVQTNLGSTEIPVNPSDDHPPSKAPALSISSESFNLVNGHHIKACSLLVKVHHTSLSQLTNGNGKHDLNSTEGSENNETENITENGEHENLEPSIKRRKMARDSLEVPKLLTAELIVYDKHAQCQLTEGEYELILAEADSCNGHHSMPTNSNQKLKNATWENITIDKSDMAVYQQFNSFSNSPTLKFRLYWSSEAATGMVERPRPLMSRDNFNGTGTEMNGHHATAHSKRDRGAGGRLSRQASTQLSANAGLLLPKEKPPRIVYQFLYNNNSRQQTEAREDLHCPWCSLNCMDLYALLKHLKLSHPRFLFTYVPIQDGARIDVSVSELYDSTYAGNPQDMISQPPGYAFSRGGPVQRTSITHILVCKPKRPTPSLTEFLEVEDHDLNYLNTVDGQRPFVSGHNRLYHYSTTGLPQPPFVINQPSTEDETDPPWLIKKICRMIDEFSDVNEGEKELMKMWNLHIQHYTYVGDTQITMALKMFIEEKGREVLAKGLYRNFVLHVCNLFEFGVLGPGHVFTAIHRMQKFVLDKDHQFSDWPKQDSHWREFPKVTDNSHNSSKEKAKVRKDFSGIFKTSDSKINPFVVLSPLHIPKSHIPSDKEDKKATNENEDESETTSNVADQQTEQEQHKQQPVSSLTS